MKRLFILAITLVSFSLISGCGGGSASSTTQDTSVDDSPISSIPSNRAPTITGTAPGAKENQFYQFQPSIFDADGDALTLSVSNLPTWLSFDAASGEISGMPSAPHIGTLNIEIIAGDGKVETRRQFNIDVAFDGLEKAVRTGNPSYLQSESTIADGVLATIESDAERYRVVKNTLFALDSDGGVLTQSLNDISWDPTHDAALLQARFGRNEAILTSNAVTNKSYVVQHHALAIVGESTTTRYAVFGGNPMRNAYRSSTSVSDDMNALMINLVDWLTQRSTTNEAPLEVVLAQLDQSVYFPDQRAVRDWLDRSYDNVNYNEATACNAASLGPCITASTDLLIVSQKLFESQDADAISNQVRAAMQAGVPVLYLHHNGELDELGQKLLPLFEVDYHGDNYWRKLSVENYAASTEATTLPADVTLIQSLVHRLKDQNFSFNLAECDDKSCPDDHAYQIEFLAPIETLQGQLRDFDQQGVDLFSTDGYRYQKLLVLLGDFYRKQVSFPMDREITPTIRFLRSMFADHTVYHHRSVNPVQPSMGTFSRSDFSHVQPTTRQVTVESKAPFRSTGAYALPGVTFQVTRIDQSDVNAYVFINTLRPGATHEFDEFGYTRPKYLQSTQFKLEPGQTMTLSSPHGGPIQLGFDAGIDLVNAAVELQFEQVGEHPYWTSNADDQRFLDALEASRYDWAELVTPWFEVHSTLDNMRTTIKSTLWNTPSGVAEGTSRFIHNYPHQLAGFAGPGIETEPEVHDFASANGLTIYIQDGVKHMNADQASCGYGCSGNPYDASWSFDPLGHGDLHELGHGLESSRSRFSDWQAHASTNIYSYYSKYRYYAETGNTAILGGCQNLPFEELFNTVQDSVDSQDPVQYMKDASLTGWSHGVAIYLQLMMRVQEDDALESGWNLIPRLHIVEREFARADDSEDTWLARRDGLGFAAMARTDARRLSGDDWLLIVLSHVTGRDLRDYLLMWGFDHSDVAATHVKSLNLPALPSALHVADANGYCLGLNHRSVPVDGRQEWPN